VITGRLEYTRDALKLYIGTLTLIVGGSIWLSREIADVDSKLRYGYLSNMLVCLLFFVTGVMVFDALRSWYRYRQAICMLDTGPIRIPSPKVPYWGAETAMLIGMLVSTAAFILYNPFLS